MERKLVRRRSVIGGVGALVTLGAVVGSSGQLVPNKPPPLRFHVAGARFHRGTERLQAGEELQIGRGQFRGELCYPILTVSGERIGFIPRKLGPLITVGATARVFSVDPNAVPWKRVVIELDRYAES